MDFPVGGSIWSLERASFVFLPKENECRLALPGDMEGGRIEEEKRAAERTEWELGCLLSKVSWGPGMYQVCMYVPCILRQVHTHTNIRIRVHKYKDTWSCGCMELHMHSQKHMPAQPCKYGYLSAHAPRRIKILFLARHGGVHL